MPAIFNDDWNTSNEAVSGEGNQVTETSGTDLNVEGSRRFEGSGNRIPEGSKVLNQEHHRVTISQGGLGAGAASVHGPGFGS